VSKALVVLLLGPILFAIRVDDKYLKSIQPITGIDAYSDYINSGNRLLPELIGSILLGLGIGLPSRILVRRPIGLLLSAQQRDRH
jgi:hypothetical protein